MPKFRLNRRAVLRGAGSIAIALPWLEIMEPEGKAWGAGGPAQRFVAIFQPGGTVRDKYTPTGTETAPVLSPILSPLEPVKDKILIIDGLDMKSAVGEQHQAGICALLTGTPQSAANRNFAGGPSVDQVIATRISAGKKSRPSVQMAVRWATGKSHGLLHPINSLNFEDNAMFSPIPPRLDPVEIFNNLFGTLTPGDGPTLVARKRSILDYVDKRYAALSPKLGMTDRMKLEQHLTKIRELEMGLMVPPVVTCKAPAQVDTSDYNPRSGLMSADNGSLVDTPTDAAIPKVGQYFMDMIVLCLACDITAVASLQWTDTEAKHTFPWLMLPQHHHFYQHDGGFKPLECEQIATWYSRQHRYLIEQMAAVDMGGHTLLDESVIFFGSELQEPPTHLKGNMPFMLAGNGGGLRTGRWLKYSSLSHNNLLVSILNLFGDMRTKFGAPQYCDGPLSGLP
jgi:hypothetical protein